MSWKDIEQKIASFLDEGKQFTIVIIEKKKIWLGAGAALLIVLSLIFFQDGVDLWKQANIPQPPLEREKIHAASIDGMDRDITDEIKDELKDEPKATVIEDISETHRHMQLKTDTQKINEPVAFENEIIYSGGGGNNIEDEAILTELFLYSIDSEEEKVIAQSEIKFGEIYEGRLSDKWIAWLDTNHIGNNIIYGMNRETGDKIEIKTCEHNRPQLRLWGDNLVWVEQGDLESDSLYLYNFSNGESVVLEVFDNSTYGTCPPSIWNDVVVWSAPGEDGGSVIKKLDLKNIDGLPVEDTLQELIDPKGFAIYPSTNGKAIAWLDALDPQKATLKLIIDGEEIIDIAQGVGRFFGVGDNFVAYTQNNNIMLYFWEDERYAHINPKGIQGRLSQCSINGNRITWYSNPPKDSEDIVNISIIEES